MPNWHSGVDLDTLGKGSSLPAGPEDAGTWLRLREDGKIDPGFIPAVGENQKIPQQSETPIASYSRAICYAMGADAWDAIIPAVDPDGGGQQASLAQAALFTKRVSCVQGTAGSAAPSSIGLVTGVGTATSRTFALTNPLTEMNRLGYVSATQVGSTCGVAIGGATFRRGASRLRGGFFFHARIGMAAPTATTRCLFGFSSATPATEPSTHGHLCAFAANAADTTLKFMSKASNGTVNIIDLGIPIKTANLVMEMYISCRPGSARVHFGHRRLDGPDYPKPVYAVDSVTLGAPLVTDVMTAYAQLSNGTVSGSVGLDISHVYTEQEY